MASPNMYDTGPLIGASIPQPTQYVPEQSLLTKNHNVAYKDIEPIRTNPAQRLRERLQAMTVERESIDSEIAKIRSALEMIDSNPAALNIVMTVNSALGRDY